MSKNNKEDMSKTCGYLLEEMIYGKIHSDLAIDKYLRNNCDKCIYYLDGCLCMKDNEKVIK